MQGLSIIIPTYNRDIKIISRAIRSVLAQKDYNFNIEIILSNNSTAPLDAGILKFPNIKIIDSSQKNGVSYARNKGTEYAKYEYLSFLDDDDYWSNNFIKLMFQKIINTKKDMIICGFKNVHNNNQIKNGKIIEESINVEDVLNYNPGFTGSNFIISKKKFIEIKGFDENLHTSNDKDFLIRFLENHGKYIVMDQYLVFRDESCHQRLTTINQKKIASTELFFQKYYKRMDKKTKNEYEFKINYYKACLEKSILKNIILIFNYPKKYRTILSTIKNILLKKWINI